MRLGEEPANGDYVAYIEALTHSNQPAPGQTVAKNHRSVPLHNGMRRAAAAEGAERITKHSAAAVPNTRHPWQWLSGRAKQVAAARRDQLAAGPKTRLPTKVLQRRPTLLLAIVAIAMVWVGLRTLLTAFSQPTFDWRDLLPPIFLLFFLGILFQAIRHPERTRAASSQQSPTPPKS
jgi:hypothetical protein